LTEFDSARIPVEEIQRRQKFAQRVGRKVSKVVENSSSLGRMVELIIWHGSLPRGMGGRMYDVDYAVFLRSASATALLEAAATFSSEITDKLEEVTWRRDLHYDGMTMFEAHTHWDIIVEDLAKTHIGVHFYQHRALLELFGDKDWRGSERPSCTFFSLFELWRRYCFFYRHWIYEGVAVYDPSCKFEGAEDLGYLPAEWFLEELHDVVGCILRGYRLCAYEVCTVADSRKLALDMVAAMAYSLEGKPMGRSVRYPSDLEEFENVVARALLKCVVLENLSAAANEYGV
jgi:hypothetical protein